MDPGDPRRKEIGAVFGPAEGEPEALLRYGLGKGGFAFKPKKNLARLQAADMFAWLEKHRAVQMQEAAVKMQQEQQGEEKMSVAAESPGNFHHSEGRTF
jgi:hypothetical protein